MEYKIVREAALEAFEKQMKEACRDGWQPQGSMQVVIAPDKNASVIFIQPVIKRG